jgi:hypothetical protein
MFPAAQPPLTRHQKLHHVFAVLALPDNAITYLTTTGTVTTVTRLVNLGTEWFSTAVEDGEISEANNSEITAFKIWYVLTKFDPDRDIITQLTHGTWEKFCSARTPGATVANVTTSSTGSTPTGTVSIKTDLRHYPCMGMAKSLRKDISHLRTRQCEDTCRTRSCHSLGSYPRIGRRNGYPQGRKT